ncbi:MAG: undecaprenyl-diphosphate phosphatase [Alphaproteobacteria bacterium]
MPLLDIIILSLIQGITEFLPVSSSGHLVLAGHALNEGKDPSWNNHMMLDVAVHIGTLFSVLIYFRHDIRDMFRGIKSAFTGQIDNHGTRMILHVTIGSIPVIIAGLALHLLKPDWLLAIEIIGWTTLIFGIILWVADRAPERKTDLGQMTLKDAFLIGLAQSLALIPGVSRSGITMTAGRFLGYSRTECAHYALLLGIIAISGAGALGSLSIIESHDLALTLDIGLAILLSFIAGWISIALMMRMLQKTSFAPFAIYRIILGLALLIYVYHDALLS